MECLLMDKGWKNNQNSLLKLKPGGHFTVLSFAVVIFHLAGGKPKKSLHERGEGRKWAHLWLCQPHLRPPITIPPFPRARCGSGRETKGGEKGRGRKRLWGRFTGLFNKLTEGWGNLLLITQNKPDWRRWKTPRGFQRLIWASCGYRPKQTCLPWWYRTVSVCRLYDCKQQCYRSTPSVTTQTVGLTNGGKQTHRHHTMPCGYKHSETGCLYCNGNCSGTHS